MKKQIASILTLGMVTVSSSLFAFPSVFPTGTTIFDPAETWSGYTIFDGPDGHGAILVDMNGNVVKQWQEIAGVPGPFRILPGGYIMGGNVQRRPHQETVALIQLDWNGNEVWRYDRMEQVRTMETENASGEKSGGELVWSSRQHHDWQREGNPVGYYAPGQEPQVLAGKTLVLAHRNVTVPDISPKRLEDDYLYELSWDGRVVWDWQASDHVDELGFSEDARNAIHRSVGFNDARESADWLHINSASYLGPNKWYDDGDLRFHPDNIMISSREANIIAIVNRNGNIVWRMGPDYTETPQLAKVGQIIGQHNPHLIPKGLPGAGNLLVFDNGGQGGYGFANPARPNGTISMTRDHSRVLEINPVTFEIVWEYTLRGTERFQFYSAYVSNAQRLPNGNTPINEGMDGRIFELTPESKIVWEYVSPYFNNDNIRTHRVYRAYRVPYDWIPQLEKPIELPVVPPDLSTFRVPVSTQ
ncbi:MAG: aryl-sulfate sulfotransferase [Gammaproteobacteria bacterium]|nr:aryl-sulfate sulfotransferase [Pseudomonadales bacterium]MCP5348517.1 aryl-sulfate sulfotransferase [Pseudomonadales bacterium]